MGSSSNIHITLVYQAEIGLDIKRKKALKDLPHMMLRVARRV